MRSPCLQLRLKSGANLIIYLVARLINLIFATFFSLYIIKIVIIKYFLPSLIHRVITDARHDSSRSTAHTTVSAISHLCWQEPRRLSECSAGGVPVMLLQLLAGAHDEGIVYTYEGNPRQNSFFFSVVIVEQW